MSKWLILFMLISSSAWSQQLIQGTIVDGESNEPVPFASIAIEGINRGTSSNLNGQFSLSVNDTTANLLISCIGYETLKIPATKANGIINLKPGVTRLSTVYITDKPLNARKIVHKAFNKITHNYNTKPFLQTFFYRHYCKDGNSYGRLVEASLDIWKNSGYRSPQAEAGKNEQIRITQLRRSLDNTRGSQGHEPISIDDILESDLVGYQVPRPTEHLSFYDNVSHLRTDLDNYTFISNGITIHDGQEVYEIEYEYRKDSALTTSGNYLHYANASGRLFITTDKFAFVKAEMKRTQDGNSVTQTVYYRKYDDDYYPYHMLLVGESRTPAWGVHAFHIELMSVDISTNSSAKFTGEMPGERELLRIPYDSTYWATSTVLRTTPLEDKIIRDLGGGRSLREQFEIFREYYHSVHRGGEDAEEKFDWLREYSVGKNVLYLIFWSEEFKPYLVELEKAKQQYPQLMGKVKFIFVSLDDNDERWHQTVSQFNFFSDGIINYRVGTQSSLARNFEVDDLPTFAVIDMEGNVILQGVPRPSDQAFKKQLHELVDTALGARH